MAGKPKRVRTYRWYVEPLDAATNKVIAGLEGICAETDTLAARVRGFDGAVALWKVTSAQFAALRRSRRGLNLKFRVFSREGHGSIRLYPFG